LPRKKESNLEKDPLWYKDAIIYQLHVKSFADSNGDGIGDFRGLTSKLGYLESLGVTALWLLPFYPSPQKDDGYDIADYFNVNPDYGTLKDFREFLREAHARGIRVITELVLNHTSSDHKWFQRARRARPGTKTRDMYVWNDSPDKYADARIIFQDFESSNWSWDSTANAYYWHRFYSHQPDLNFDNPNVRKEMFRVMDFWFKMGVDGVRLDAVPYLYEREDTNCENLPETHKFLKELRAHVDRKFEDKMLLAEANQWPEDAAAYFGDGDECNMAFHFPVMPRMFMAIQMEDSFPITDILKDTPDIPENCQWAMFLRNHDELTLEMVTDEERDYMYRVYARDPRTKINLGIRRRLAPLLGNNRRKIELMNILLLSMPGTPVLYYGDEISMGDNYYLGDRNGVRTPMQWSPDRNAGFSKANPQKLFLPVIIDPEHHYETLNVENQERNLSSLLWWMRRVIAMRKQYRAFSRGSFELISSDNPKVLSFARKFEDETIIVIVNLSRFSQVVNLDLSEYEGCIPEEAFSQNLFPAIKQDEYVLTLGPHNHYWFLMHPESEFEKEIEFDGDLVISVRGEWLNLIRGRQRERFEKAILPKYVKKARWFGAKTKNIRRVKIEEEAFTALTPASSVVLIIRVTYTDSSHDLFVLPLSYATEKEAEQLTEDYPQSLVVRLRAEGEEGIVYDAVYDESFHRTLLTSIWRRKKIKGRNSDFIGRPGRKLRRILADTGVELESRPMKAEQSNSSIVYDDKIVLKLYRHMQGGMNPDYEITRYLTEKAKFDNIPAYTGSIEYIDKNGDNYIMAMAQKFVENSGDAWGYASDVVSKYFDRSLAKGKPAYELMEEYPAFTRVSEDNIPNIMRELIGGLFLEMMSILGRRTGEMHLALMGDPDDKDFKPESFSTLYQRALYQSMQSLVRRTLKLLDKNIKQVPDEVRGQAEMIRKSEDEILKRMKRILRKKMSAKRTRIHGDYHLGQVLNTGKDFVILDFEGEPARAISERRLKHSPLKDVAGMIRSIHYVAYSYFMTRPKLHAEQMNLLESWIEPWYLYVSGAFFAAYMETVGESKIIPRENDELETLLQTFLLEKGIYELGYELNHRPDWITIPIRGIEYLLVT
jgi:maltose alpha-D-glucosyltransferase/alpha-amylase